MAASQGFIIVGCSSCNTYRGRVDFFNRTSFSSAKLGAIDGSTDNQMLGSDVQVI
jgi:hypothetical protein